MPPITRLALPRTFSTFLLLPFTTAAAFALTATPSTTEGPYYTLSSANQADKSHFTGEGIDNDLTHIYSTSTQCTTTTSCPLFLLSGTLVNTSGTAIAGATIELWHADSGGIYWYTSSSSTTNAYANRDKNFQGYGTCVTDSSGAWSFRTIKPGLYTGRIRHFHFKVTINGTTYVTSQFMFSEDSASYSSDGVASPLVSAGTMSLVTLAPTAGTDSSGNSVLIASKQIVIDYTGSGSGSGSGSTGSGPTVTANPSPAAIGVGDAVTFAVTATSSTSMTYQWRKDGAAISGATAATYTIAGATTADAGAYTVAVTNSSGTTVSSAASLLVTAVTSNTANSLINISARATIPSSSTLITGFVIESTSGKRLLVRAVGPTLSTLGVNGAVSDPVLSVFDASGNIVATNDNWDSSLSSTFSQAGAFALSSGSKDSAVVLSLPGGIGTAHVTSNAAGVALVETYDLDGATSASRLVNLSARAPIGTGDAVLIAGFVVNGTGGKRILVRGIGPKLTAYGVTNALSDPKLAVYNSSSVKIAENDDWNASLTSLFTALGAFALDANSKDAALLVTLPAGSGYTVVVSGVGTATGEAVVELYEIPE